MRAFTCVIVLGFSLGACQQTDGSNARNAGGSVNIAPKKPASKPVLPSDSGPTPPVGDDGGGGGKLTPTQQAASRDAASGLPTGKRQHKPYQVVKPTQ